MWPWEHLALGYLLYSPLTRVVYGRAPDATTVISLAVGTQFPDLVDKPLAWSLGLIPSGRMLAHSVFTTAIVVAVVLYVTRERFTAEGSAFSVGYASHLLGDALASLRAGTYSGMEFLFWPFLGSARPDGETSVIARLLELQPSEVVAADFHLFVLVVSLWAVDGMPVLSDAVRLLWRQLVPRSPI